MSSAKFITLWNRILSAAGAQNVDLISSISLDTLNHVLQKHHENSVDRERYKYKMVRPLAGQAGRNFTLLVDLTQPLQIAYEGDVTVFSPAKGWAMLPGPFPLAGSGVTKPGDIPKPNIRVKIPAVVLHLTWPKVNGSGDNSWTPSGLSAELAAYVSFVRFGGRVSLQIIPTAVSFSFAKVIAAAKRKEQARLTSDNLCADCEQKFSDLLLIGLNEFSVELLPRLVQTIELPSIDVESIELHPTILDVAKEFISFGATMDAQQLLSNVQQQFGIALGALQYAAQADIQAAGGLDALVVERTNKAGEMIYRSRKEVSKRMPKSNAVLEDLRLSLQEKARGIPEGASSVSAVSEGIALAFNEFFATAAVNCSLPPGEDKCGDDKTIIPETLKGHVCSWSHIDHGDVHFNGATIDVSVAVNFGGSIVACIRKFWDCSWGWDCHSMGLSVKGRPAINLSLLADGGGVRFKCKVDLGNLDLDTGLPYPFNKVVKFFFDLIMDFFEAILNLIGLAMSFVVIPVSVPLPGQNTKVSFSNFNGFSYTAPAALGGRANFIGHTVSVDAK